MAEGERVDRAEEMRVDIDRRGTTMRVFIKSG
jgi:hypothetical protein